MDPMDGHHVAEEAEKSAPQRAWVDAEFDKLDGSPSEIRQVTLELDERGWIHMRGGPTGYESFDSRDAVRDFAPGAEERPWVACFGTRGRYAQCLVSADQVRLALECFGLLPVAA